MGILELLEWHLGGVSSVAVGGALAVFLSWLREARFSDGFGLGLSALRSCVDQQINTRSSST